MPGQHPRHRMPSVTRSPTASAMVAAATAATAASEHGAATREEGSKSLVFQKHQSGKQSCCLWSLVRGRLPESWPSLPRKSYLVVFREPSSGIFSWEQLLPESLSGCSSSLKRSATHWAVRRASGSWSQHSVSVSHTIWMPWWLSQKLGISGRPRSLSTLSFMLSTQGCSRTLEPNGGS